MSPLFALILCCFFTFYLIRMDAELHPETSRALWIPTMWHLILSSKPVTTWFNAGAGTSSTDVYLEGSPVDAGVFLLLILAALIILFRRRLSFSTIVKNNAWLFVFMLYCGISTIWSDYSFVSFKRWIKEIGNVSMVLIVLTEAKPVEAVKVLFNRSIYALVPMSIVLIKYFPDFGRQFSRSGEAMYTGVTLHKNSLGILCAFIFILFIWDYKNWSKSNTFLEKKNKFMHILILLMNLWLISLAHSATSEMCALAGVAVLVGLEFPVLKRHAKHIGKYVLAASLVIFLLYEMYDIQGLMLSGLDRDATLTGRTQIWEQVLSMKTNPVIGTGYDSFWLGDRIQSFWDQYWWQPNQAHNGYLETYINLGWIGVVLLLGIIISTYRKITSKFIVDFDYQRLRISLLLIAVLSNFTEAYFKGICQIWFIFLLVVMEYPRPGSIAQTYNPQPDNLRSHHAALRISRAFNITQKSS